LVDFSSKKVVVDSLTRGQKTSIDAVESFAKRFSRLVPPFNGLEAHISPLVVKATIPEHGRPSGIGTHGEVPSVIQQRVQGDHSIAFSGRQTTITRVVGGVGRTPNTRRLGSATPPDVVIALNNVNATRP
jgi:hypothetical protein